jgi:hypothetical protein
MKGASLAGLEMERSKRKAKPVEEEGEEEEEQPKVKKQKTKDAEEETVWEVRRSSPLSPCSILSRLGILSWEGKGRFGSAASKGRFTSIFENTTTIRTPVKRSQATRASLSLWSNGKSSPNQSPRSPNRQRTSPDQ